MKWIGWLVWLGVVGTVQAQTDSTALARPDSVVVDSATAAPVAPRRFTVTGYLKNLNTIAIPGWADQWTFDGQLHNRLKFRYTPTPGLTVAVDVRNRLFFGQSLTQNPAFIIQSARSLDYVRLGGVVFQQRSVLLHSVVDRAYVNYERGSWQVTLGKQRVNWAESYVWNPNDIVNAYSFFDFDYEERPGTDALLVRRYLNAQQSVEMVANWVGSWRASSLAGLYRFNHAGTDYQVLLGKRDSSWVAGAGWAGQLGNGGLKGEWTYFGPAPGRPGTLLGDIAYDYTWPNTFTLRLEALLNTSPTRTAAFTYLTQPVTARTLINNHLSLFGGVSYEFTPLVVGTLNSIWNVDDGSYFVNPSVNLNLNEDVELLVTAQVLAGRPGSLFAGVGSYVFTRLKWSF